MNVNLSYGLRCSIIAGSYFCMALVGLMFDVGETNVSPMWPPSAVAAIVLYRNRSSMACILFGAFMANFFIFVMRGTDLDMSTVMSAGISIGNTIEGLIVGAALRRGMYENSYEFKRFLLVSFLACCISGLNGAFWICLGGIIDIKDLLFHIFVWTVGDFNGVVVIVPVFIAFEKWGWSRSAVYGALFFGCIYAGFEQGVNDLAENTAWPSAIFLFFIYCFMAYMVYRHKLRVGLSMLFIMTIMTVVRVGIVDDYERLSVEGDLALISAMTLITLVALSVFPLVSHQLDQRDSPFQILKTSSVFGVGLMAVSAIIIDIFLRLR